MRAISLLALSVALLSGCATIPEGAPTAMVRFTSNVDLHMSTKCGPHASAVKLGLIGNQFWNEESPVRMLGTQPGKRNDVLERLVPAEEEIGFRLHGGTATGVNTGMACTYYLTFTPRKDEQYHVHYELNTAAKACSARLYRLSEKNGAIERTPLQAKRFKEATFGTVDRPCQDLTI
jgi:hypothetical protein